MTFQPGHKHSEATKKKIGDIHRRPIWFKCDQCGKESFDKPSAYARKIKHFCSQDCYTAYKINMSKEEHPRYGAGHSIEERTKRRKARSDLNHAKRIGKVQKQPCLICEEQKVEAHHDNYDEPLNVKWLCLKHHRIYEHPDLLGGEDA